MARNRSFPAVESCFRRFRHPSSVYPVHFSMVVFPGSAAEREQRRRLLAALLVSLLAHLLVAAILPRAVGTAGEGLPRSDAVLVTLRGAVSQQAALASPAESVSHSDEPAAAEAASDDLPEREALLMTLGERRLAAHRPPYLAEPSVLGVAAGSWYFSRSELTRPPALLDEAQVQLPALADNADRAAAPSGRLVLRVLVGAGGEVDRVEVASSTLPPAFAESAVAAFSQVRFRPGEIEGVAVSSEARFEIVFDGKEAGSSHLTGGVVVR